jgi:NAD(P)-dependent dehydrogenase (short-subunit alcohol dehydrogenase family)
MGRLDGKRAVITGGTSGIGLATAKLFANEGAHVAIVGRRQEQLDEAARDIGPNVIPFQGDVSNLNDLDRLYEAVGPKGPVDVVFANAGFQEPAPLSSCSEEQFDAVFAINVKGVLFTVQKALPLMSDGGSIILTGSAGGSKGTPGFGLYGSTKAAVRSFARTLTAELSERGIRTNVISPGPIDTPLVAGVPPEAAKRMIATIPMGRMGTDDEVAHAALFLASSESSYVTGIELFVDGGRAQVLVSV